jgi:hypothetical protein
MTQMFTSGSFALSFSQARALGREQQVPLEKEEEKDDDDSQSSQSAKRKHIKIAPLKMDYNFIITHQIQRSRRNRRLLSFQGIRRMESLVEHLKKHFLQYKQEVFHP